MERLYILLPVHNRREITEGFVRCLQEQSFKNFHLVLIDDGSNDGTADRVLELVPHATVVRGSGNLWWAGALQKGIEWLCANGAKDSDIVLLANDDVRFGANYFDAASSYLFDKKGVLLLSKFSCDGGGKIDESGIVVDLKRLSFRMVQKDEAANCFSTRGLFVRFGDMKEIGNFRPRLLPHYLSDYEYTIRAVRKGMSLEQADSVFLCPNLESTGYHTFDEKDLWKFLRRYFSKKSVANPIYWSSFIVLAVPPMWVMPNLSRVWYRTVKAIAKRVMSSVGGCSGDVACK